MNFNDYQAKAHAFSKDILIGHYIIYPVLGLVGEAGELANKVKKRFRDFKEEPMHTFVDNLAAREAIIDELGDVLWYASEIATQLAVNLDYVAERNLEKLHSRNERGVIGGSGDNR